MLLPPPTQCPSAEQVPPFAHATVDAQSAVQKPPEQYVPLGHGIDPLHAEPQPGGDAAPAQTPASFPPPTQCPSAEHVWVPGHASAEEQSAVQTPA